MTIGKLLRGGDEPREALSPNYRPIDNSLRMRSKVTYPAMVRTTAVGIATAKKRLDVHWRIWAIVPTIETLVVAMVNATKSLLNKRCSRKDASSLTEPNFFRRNS